MPNPIYNTIIIGAGLAGLSAGRILQNASGTVLLIDKGQVPGGRMATRRIAQGVFDHGAQFITVRSEVFKSQMDAWLNTEAAHVWGHGFQKKDGHPRYAGAKGMNRLARTLTDDLEIKLGETVTDIRLHMTGATGYTAGATGDTAGAAGYTAGATGDTAGAAGGHSAASHTWVVQTQRGEYGAKALIITAPLPQTRGLLQSVDLPGDELAKIDSVEYEACLALLLNLKKSLSLPHPGAVQLGSEPLAWLGDNQAKGISTVPALTVHSGPDFAAANWSRSDEDIYNRLIPHLDEWLQPADIADWQVKRWRYSKPRRPLDESYLRLSAPAPIFLAGDAFMRARVEGAYLSGRAAAMALIAELFPRR